MLGFLSLSKDSKIVVKKDQIFFVHIPDNVSEDEIKMCLSKTAKTFADLFNTNKVFLNFGKDKVIEYEFKI